MPGWAGNWFLLVTFALVAATSAHLLLSRLRGVGKARIGAEYLAVALGGAALISGTFQSNAQVAAWKMENLRPRIEGAAGLVKSGVEWAADFECSRTFHRTEWSPPNLDQIEAQRAEACRRLTRIRDTQSTWLRPERSIDMRLFQQPPLRERWIASDTETVRAAVADYNAVMSQYLSFKRAGPTPLEVLFTIITPYAAALALALGLATVAYPRNETGRRSRRRSASGAPPTTP
jgi:hypothetical protein